MLEFNRIFVLDTEFQKPDGEPHRPICLCMIELASQQRWELFFDRPQSCPVEWQPNDLVIGYNLAAEWGTFLARDWTLPPNCIDLYFEHLLQMNGAKKLGLVEDPIVRAESVKLTTALRLCGLQDRINVDKVEERDYIIANGVVPPPGMTLEDHKARVVTYCWSDVYATANLIKPFFNLINIDQALLRGAFSRAVAWMERNGLPLDVGSLRIIQQHHEELLRFVIEETERQYNYGVFKGRVLEQKAFAELLQRNEWHHHWPLTPAGKYAKDSKTLDAKAKVYPELEPLRALMSTLGKLRTNKIKVGSDGRTRPPVWPLIQASSRCNPTGECILGQSAWLRHLIMPPKGYAVVIVDVVAEEFAIAAALSGDQQMVEIYMSGRDIYLQIAIMGGAVPADATKESHPLIRAKYKTAMLAMN